MADIGASAAMQLQQSVPVVVQGPNGQQQLHYITLSALQGTSQQQQLPAWPVMPLPSPLPTSTNTIALLPLTLLLLLLRKLPCGLSSGSGFAVQCGAP